MMLLAKNYALFRYLQEYWTAYWKELEELFYFLFFFFSILLYCIINKRIPFKYSFRFDSRYSRPPKQTHPICQVTFLHLLNHPVFHNKPLNPPYPPFLPLALWTNVSPLLTNDQFLKKRVKCVVRSAQLFHSTINHRADIPQTGHTLILDGVML